jgi:single-stranded-DNA-specific exonuclease
VTAQVLVNRGVADPEAAARFLRPKISHLEDPSRLDGAAEAASRIRGAVARCEKVLVFGDYDVDGVTASALLSRLLGLFGADCEVYLPSRMEEGYGLTPAAVEGIVGRRPGLVVTVDCGVRAVGEVRALKAAGIDVIVTDHHEPGERLPEADVVVNPRLDGCGYPFKDLSGVGIAFKLAWAVATRASGAKKVTPELRGFLLDSVGLVALGTVADVAPLLGENRAFVSHGLEVLSRTEHAGLRALKEVSGVSRRPLTARDLAFGLGPRLNAAGRTGRADDALALLLEEEDASRARGLASSLDRRNRERQRIEEGILREAASLAQAEDESRASLVLSSDEWHQGVIGIVASRVASRTWRPTVLVAFEGDEGKGSARSVEGVDVARALDECAGCLEGHGGHAMAAGVRLRRSRLEEFSRAFEGAVRRQLGGGLPRPVLAVDAALRPEDLTLGLAEETDRLRPFGQGNRRPLFCAGRLELGGELRPLGRKGSHYAFEVASNGRRLRAVAFDFADRRRELDRLAWKRVDLAFELRMSDWSGPEGFELCVKDVRPASGRRDPCLPAGKASEVVH